uniref:Uncharacterized protein n=1 Tax=Echinococcus granulosus TaxID=6210 RepID=A0A068WYN1_ECHGR|nr:hypothetical protein EgrG_000567600 [Echinococcus granulosus]
MLRCGNYGTLVTVDWGRFAVLTLRCGLFARSNEPEVDGGGGGGVVFKEVERSVGKQAIPMAWRAILASDGYSSQEVRRSCDCAHR